MAGGAVDFREAERGVQSREMVCDGGKNAGIRMGLMRLFVCERVRVQQAGPSQNRGAATRRN